MASAYGLYSHIQSNRRRSVALLVGLFLLIFVLLFAGSLLASAFLIDGTLEDMLRDAWRSALEAAPYAVIAVALWLLIAYRFHEMMIDWVTGGREISRQDDARLYNLLENLCISRGIPMPRLKVMPNEALNAFASGLNQKQYSVTVTSALLDALDDRELEAVLAHELTHIRNGDVRVMVIAAVVAGIVTFAGELMFRMIMQGPRISYGGLGGGSGSRSGDRKSAGAMMAAIAIAFLLVAAAWFLSLFLRAALSRSREYLADAGAVELTKNPDAMIGALRKIEGRAEIPRVPSGLMEMCIENRKSGIADLFASHPPIEDRIRALVEHAGGRDLLPASAESPLPPRQGPWGAAPT